jgi:histidinol-phosphate/aromatic aminotransferase/cobyric acid decarboxylase-like protein
LRKRSSHACYHGGASFEAIGVRFDGLARRQDVINADVLDAWFDPAPGVTRALEEHLPWLLRSSPPTGAEGLIATVAEARGVPEDCLVAGAGSSALIYLALQRWLSSKSHALIIEPSYGEYAHVLEHVVRCKVDRLLLRREDNFALEPERLAGVLKRGYDIAVLVNPNNPTGTLLPRRSLEPVLADAPGRTRLWIDEAYIDYASPDESLEQFSARSSNIVVCKSLSKVYALSGVRAAYVCCHPRVAADLRSVTPPWAVSLPAQVAAVIALKDPAYYAARYQQTEELRVGLAGSLRREAGVETISGVINAVICLLPSECPNAASVSLSCRERGLFVRDCRPTCPSLGSHALRIAVKDAATNARMTKILAEVLAR